MKTDKKINILIIIVGIVVVTLSVLKITGVFDLNNSSNEFEIDTSKLELVDECDSKSFGGQEFDYPQVYIKTRLYNNGLLTQEAISSGDNFICYAEATIYSWYDCDLSKVTYNDLELNTLGAHVANENEYWKTVNYSGLIVPNDCVSAKLNGKDIGIEVAQLKNGDEETTVKMITYAYRENEKNMIFELTDEKGNIHTFDGRIKK